MPPTPARLLDAVRRFRIHRRRRGAAAASAGRHGGRSSGTQSRRGTRRPQHDAPNVRLARKAWSDFIPRPKAHRRTADRRRNRRIPASPGAPRRPKRDAQLERLIFNPAPDYAELLARQEQEELPTPADTPANADDRWRESTPSSPPTTRPARRTASLRPRCQRNEPRPRQGPCTRRRLATQRKCRKIYS